MATKPVKPKKIVNKSKAKPVLKAKKPKIDPKKLIPDFILKMANEYPELLVIDVDKYSALLVKKKVVTVHEELCPGTMSPVERVVEKTFFHTFMLQWDGKINNSDKLEEIGFPVMFVETPQEALYEIQKA
jgi:hypothetical protein